MNASSPIDPGVPRSKSIAQRTLLVATCAHGTTRIGARKELVGDDVSRALAWSERAGAGVLAGSELAITGRGAAAPSAPTFEVGESGTLWRLTLAVLALSNGSADVRVLRSGTLVQRTSPALIGALRAAGATIEHEAGVDSVRPCRAPSGLELVRPASSQEVSGLLIALARTGQTHELHVHGPIPSRPYVEITKGVLESFGVQIDELSSSGESARFRVRGPLIAPADVVTIEPDASAAAVALAAGAIVDRVVRVPGLGRDSIQGDIRIVDRLREFGAAVELDHAAVTARGSVRQAVRLDLADTPDLAPVCAALGAVVALRGSDATRTELIGLETLPGKESSRIAVLAAGLRQLGLAVEDDERSLRIGPVPSGPGDVATSTDPLELAVAGDHRMAFAFALIGLVREGLGVDQPAAVAKSWPGFWEFEARLRAACGTGRSD